MRLSIVRLLGGLLAIATVGAVATPAPAAAQDWLSDRKRAEGPGIRLGDFELHPGIGIEGGYDSNVFYSDGSAASTPILGSGMLRVTPHFLFSTISAQREAEGEARDSATAAPPTVQFRGGISASYYAFFIDQAKNNLGLDADLNLVILPERPFTITLHERFGRTIRPFTEQRAADVAAARFDFGRNENDAGVNFSFGTPGRLLSGNVGYSLVYNFFDGDQFTFADSLAHKFAGGASFRFLPQTAFVYDFQGEYKTYPSYNAGTAADIGAARLTPGFNLRTRIGLNGAFTNTLSATVMVGYAAGFYGSLVENYDSIAAQAELRWQASNNVKFALGYDRNFAPSYIGQYVGTDRGYLNFQLLLGGSFLIGADASVALVNFGVPLAADGVTALGCSVDPGTAACPNAEADRSDIRVSTGLFAEYRLTDWLGINGTLRYTLDSTDYRYFVLDRIGAPPIVDPAGYSKVEAWLGVRAFY
jgi:hypothetical protein